MSAGTELPSRQQQLKQEPKIPQSILPHMIAKQKSHNIMHGQNSSQNVPMTTKNNHQDDINDRHKTSVSRQEIMHDVSQAEE